MSCETGFKRGQLGCLLPYIEKAPDERKDYILNWAEWLASPDSVPDTIASVVWTVPAGVTEVATSHTTTAAVIWLDGGVDGVNYTISCQITTAGGRVADQGFDLRVRNP